MNRHSKLSMLDPRIFLTMSIIVINFGVLVGMELSGGSTNPEVLLRFGAKYNPLIWHGEWWRLFTMMFLHIGFIHACSFLAPWPRTRIRPSMVQTARPISTGRCPWRTK